jgi:3-methyladenine DNA glycosylase AlkD
MISDIRALLESSADPGNSIFSAGLTPGCGKLLGVRLPRLREIAKDFAKQFETNRTEYDAYCAYTLSGKAEYQEEIMIHGLSVGYLKTDIETVLQYFDAFMPLDTNWAINDSVCMTMKIFAKHRERVWQFLEPYWKSGKTYYIRAALVIMLSLFVTEEYLPRMLAVLDAVCPADSDAVSGVVHNDDYYVHMAAAWCLSVCYVKFPEQVMPYLIHARLDDDTYNKALQKIVESFRCPADMKDCIRSMKRKG